MGATTEIAWTDATFNPWWGCQRVSPGCEHCYAETFSKRVGLKVWGPTSDRRFFGDKHWAEPLKWNRLAERAGIRKRVFCASMADVFESRPGLAGHRVRLGRLILDTPWLDWQILTKRPQNMVHMGALMFPEGWPHNVWAGTTVEDQQRADERIPEIMKVPAAVRFLSYEPALGPVHFGDALEEEGYESNGPQGWVQTREHGIDWVIVGGESGHAARPFDLDWARSTVQQCKEAGVACFVKQMGADPIDGLAGCEVHFRDRAKGADWDEWPAELRVREFPEATK